MRAVGFTEFGGPEVLHIVSLPVPAPGPRAPDIESYFMQRQGGV